MEYTASYNLASMVHIHLPHMQCYLEPMELSLLCILCYTVIVMIQYYSVNGTASISEHQHCHFAVYQWKQVSDQHQQNSFQAWLHIENLYHRLLNDCQ